MVFRAPLDGAPATRRRWLVIVGVGALVVLDAILIVWLLARPTAVEADAPPAGPSPVSTGSPSGSR